ncbi:hypothetical protein CYJ10_27290 [Cupriavidus pauculus]|uniref:Uncharacterized protein n=2 Tax=Cupriavidus pauculus TaxID=82633 RepID=A0A2N5C5P6_9BURK|nr:hypothetical protein CYJ10_27290 [Cupriavidus pauculus]
MCGLCLLVITLMIWAVQGQVSQQNGNVPVAVISCGTIIAVFAWLLARLYSLCSIVVSDDGVRQSFVLSNGKLCEHSYLGWDQIHRVSFRGSSYHFLGMDGAKLELNTTLFGDAEATIDAVRERLPGRLLSQLE